MASKNKKQPARKDTAADPSVEVERLIAKGRLKDAVKEAKLCFRSVSTEVNRRLMERAYFLRAQQLFRERMPTSARDVAQHLLEFGVTDPALVEGVVGLLLALGMNGEAIRIQGRVEDPAARDRLVRRAADQAVLHPERALEAFAAEIGQGPARVREALAALEAGDEQKALAALRDIARGSPLADWRLFVRGLAAFHRGAGDEARANWDRLEPDRAAAKIARSLQGLQGQDPSAVQDLSALEQAAYGEPILGPLRQLRQQVAQGEWLEALRSLAPVRFALRRVDPMLAERLTRVLFSLMVRALEDLEERQVRSLVGQFTRVAEPMTIDPQWNRLWAIVSERMLDDLFKAEEYWKRYLADLNTLPALKPEEQHLAQALVWNHLAETLLNDLEEYEPPAFREELEDDRAAQRHAIGCLEESLRICPAHRPTYRLLIRAHEQSKQRVQAAAAARRLLEAFPDDFDTLMHLADYHFKNNEFALAAEYAHRARAVKPLDKSAADTEWGALVGLARQHAIAGRWDESRAAFLAADRVMPERAQETHLLARKVALEIKAGQADRAETWINDALERLPDPGALWLALTIEAGRYQLPNEHKDRFESRWAGVLSKKTRSETAGAIADLLTRFVAGEVDYPGRAEHLAQVVKYLAGTTRIKYRPEDLLAVCHLLVHLPKEKLLLEKLTRRGRKLFPKAPFYLMLEADQEMKKGPFRANVGLARRNFEQALELAQASSDPADAALVPGIREGLSLVNDLTSGPHGFPFGGFGGRAPSPRDLLDALAEFGGFGFDEDDDDDDDFDDGRPAPSRQGRGKGRKR